MIDAGEFDYVIAGGGTAGCVVAARLSEDPSVSVCLIEAGPSDVDDPAILRLEDWMFLLDSGYDWDYLSSRRRRATASCATPARRCSAGARRTTRASPSGRPKEDLDEWAATAVARAGARRTAGR